MKLSLASVAVLALSTNCASAWSINAGRSLARYSVANRHFSAAALFSYSTEVTGETGTETFRLGFKGEVSV